MKKSGVLTKSLLVDIILTLITFGLWNLWVQVRQINDVESITGENHFYPLIVILLLAIFTFGIYFFYHEYRMTAILHQKKDGQTKPVIEIGIALLTFFGLWFITDTYQQSLINDIVEKGK